MLEKICFRASLFDTIRIGLVQSLKNTYDFKWLPEWEPQEAVFLALPQRPEIWSGRYDQVLEQWLRLALQIARKQKLCILYHLEPLRKHCMQHMQQIAPELAQICALNIHWLLVPTDDVWVRDYGPLFICDSQAKTFGLDYRFNAWGIKFPEYKNDDLAASKICTWLEIQSLPRDWIMEGGALESNGSILITTESCLLNPNRTEYLERNQWEQQLKSDLGVRQIIWLPQGLPGDDTDGHVDMFARFINPHQMVLNLPQRNHVAFDSMQSNYKHLLRELPGGINIIELPMPAAIYGGSKPLPRTYANFLIINDAVLVPIYNVVEDELALEILDTCFPGRSLQPIYAGDIILEGGALHCLSMQVSDSKDVHIRDSSIQT